jgi:hypothetical protein
MTIAVLWHEDELLWCAADTRLVGGDEDKTTSEVAAKIYSIPVATSAFDPSLDPNLVGLHRRAPHYRTQYGFVYAGSALPASQTAITTSTLLQNLARPGGRWDPPRFESMAELVKRLAYRFMADKRQFGADGLFSAAFFGWCPHSERYKVAFLDGRIDGGSFRVDLSFPSQPNTNGDPWLVLGSGSTAFHSTLADYRKNEPNITKRVPRRVIDRMIANGEEKTVGGATSLGAAFPGGFELFYAVEPIVPGQPLSRRVFNGLDLDTEIGPIDQYVVAATGIA